MQYKVLMKQVVKQSKQIDNSLEAQVPKIVDNIRISKHSNQR